VFSVVSLYDQERTMPTFDQPSLACLSRVQGCLAGQIAGDSLGSLVEFETAASIERRYPGGVRLLSDGGTWGTIAGQPTDDSELALALSRSLALLGRYDMDAVARSYAKWYASGPFDIGGTTRAALSPAAAADRAGAGVAKAAQESANRSSQANGALMRISPLGIFGVQIAPADLAACARADASLTHPHVACQDSNVAYTAAITFAIRTGAPPDRIYDHALELLEENGLGATVSRCLREAESHPPADYERHQGWVLVALQNAFYQLLHAPNLEEGIVDTVRRGGDTDTNAAIAGALLGAAWGLQAVPEQWLDCILNCRPQEGRENVRRPRPQEYWPVDVLTLAARLLGNAALSD
jgi:ADP-ribosyl-[dinitrogen reductase] hydrolase